MRPDLHLDILKWLRARDRRSFRRVGAVAYKAGQGGHLALIRWLNAKGDDVRGAWHGAAIGGHLRVLKWLLRKRGHPSDYDTSQLFQAAIEHRQSQVMPFIIGTFHV